LENLKGKGRLGHLGAEGRIITANICVMIGAEIVIFILTILICNTEIILPPVKQA
jgi:hypothetical protein